MDEQDQTREHLILFELTVPFTQQVLHEHYRDLVQIWHPDRYAHNERLKAKAEEKLKLINEAYENLSKKCDVINKHGSEKRTASRGEAKAKRATPRHKNADYMSLASTAFESCNYPEAYRYYSKYLEEDPDSYLAWMGKGTSAGWQSTFLESHLAEMSACYARAIEAAPPDRREAIRRGTAIAKAELVNALFKLYNDTLRQVLPTAGAGATGIPAVWNQYLRVGNEMLRILEEALVSLPDNVDVMCLIIALCGGWIEGVWYTDQTTFRFNTHPKRFVCLTLEAEKIVRDKIALYADRIKKIVPEYVAPQFNTPSPGCFVATCVCGNSNHPYVRSLRRLRDEKLCLSLTGRHFISIYNKYGPGVAAFIRDKPRLKKILKMALVRPLGIMAARLLRHGV